MTSEPTLPDVELRAGVRPVDGPNPALIVDVDSDGEDGVVRLRGELDAATRSQVLDLLAPGRPATVIDLTELTFLDCSGYRSLVATRLAVEGDGKTLTLRGPVGQPARLLELISALPRASG